LSTGRSPARTAVIERLSHPALTGLTQHQLRELTSRLAMRQSAQAERLSYQRRGGPRQPLGETSCLTLVWAVLDRASRGRRGLTMTSDGLRLPQDVRRSLLDPPAQLRPCTVTTSQASDSPENVSAVA
jgi:hypothetical protein